MTSRSTTTRSTSVRASSRDVGAVVWLAVIALAPIVLLTLTTALSTTPLCASGDETGAGTTFEASSLALGGLHRLVAATLGARGAHDEFLVATLWLPCSTGGTAVGSAVADEVDLAVGPSVPGLSRAARPRRLI